MRVLLIGANGQLGTDLRAALQGADLTAPDRSELDVTRREQVLSAVMAADPDVVINTSAFHRVDDIEDDAEEAFRVNTLGVINLAGACREASSRLVHFSTDYVFSGKKGAPYVEDDPPDPINVYGVSKAAGEGLLRLRLDDHLLIRTSGLFGVAGSSGKGGNFIETMRRLARKGDEFRVVNDQVFSPTSAADLAVAVRELLEAGARGTFHVTNSGTCSWYEFARKIFELTGMSAKMIPVSTESFGARATRPPCSVLANRRLEGLGPARLRPWEEALADYLERRPS